MITIQEARLIVNGFNYDLNEIENHLNEQDEYINDVAKSAIQFANAMKLLKYMTRNNLDRINRMYDAKAENLDIFAKDDDVSNFFNTATPTEGWFSIIVLDKDSPLYLQEISMMVEHMFNSETRELTRRIISFYVNGVETNYYNDNLGEYKENKYPPIHDTIVDYITYTKIKVKQLNDIRKATSVENHPIG